MYSVFNDTVGGVLFASVCHTLSQYIAKIRKGIWKSFATFLVDLHVFVQLSHLVAGRQGLCCFYLTSSCKYTLFSFLKWRWKDHTGKTLTNISPTENVVSWRIEPTSPTLHVPTCPLATWSCFSHHHPQTQQKSTIFTSFKVSQKQTPFMGGTISHVAIIKL
jgi:hypothetical protein